MSSFDVTFAGVVLAGGASSRFHGQKALAPFNGQPFYQRAISILEPSVDQVVIVAKPELKESLLLHETTIVIEDEAEFAGSGPLAGIYSAMNAIQAEWYVVLAVDMPLMNAYTINQLIKCTENTSFHAHIPFIEGRIQPLSALYHTSCKESIYHQLQNNHYRMSDLFQKVQTRYWSEEELVVSPAVFQNVNDSLTYEQLLQQRSNR
ncbi:molybdenum cofactor guanylyltransferase [Alkalicoccobacillus gibsonii]|uniref:molybdenum cofactor guanylyltransferase n=1 Tax=Alkalicoccobacillus gibsonii TaxID=79881 RepID=UPI003F7C58E0